MNVNFEFAALLPSPYSRVKKCAKFKTNIHLVSVDSFLYYISSRFFNEERSQSDFDKSRQKLLKRASQANAFKYYARDRWDRMDYSGISFIKLYYVFYYIHGA